MMREETALRGSTAYALSVVEKNIAEKDVLRFHKAKKETDEYKTLEVVYNSSHSGY